MYESSQLFLSPHLSPDSACTTSVCRQKCFQGKCLSESISSVMFTSVFFAGLRCFKEQRLTNNFMAWLACLKHWTVELLSVPVDLGFSFGPLDRLMEGAGKPWGQEIVQGFCFHVFLAFSVIHLKCSPLIFLFPELWSCSTLFMSCFYTTSLSLALKVLPPASCADVLYIQTSWMMAMSAQ